MNSIYNQKDSFIINKVFEMYDYIDFDDNDYNYIVSNSINNTLNNTKENEDYNEVLIDELNLQITKYIKTKIADDSELIKILSKYVNMHIETSKSYDNTLEGFKKIAWLFNTLDYIPSFEICVNIINNIEQIEKMIKKIIEVNDEEIKNGQVFDIFDDDFSSSLLYTYCVIKNIEVSKNIDDEQNDNSTIEYEKEFNNNTLNMYLNSLDKDILTNDEEIEIGYRVLNGDETAKEILINKNRRFAVNIAKRYIGRGVPFLDLIQAANIGLIKAVDKFDVSKGYRFTTYSYYLIRKSINDAISNESRNIKVPINMLYKICKYKKVYLLLQDKLKKEPTIEDIAIEFNISKEEATEIYNLQFDTLSLNFMVTEKENSEFENLIPIDDNLEDSIMRINLKSEISSLLKKCNLTDRELKVLILRNGFYNNEIKTFEEIGNIFNVSKQRAKQIEAQALYKLRNYEDIDKFSIYLDDPDSALENLEKFRKLYIMDKENKKRSLSK